MDRTIPRSAQEPRLTAFISQDPKMIDAYNNKQDLYAVIAQSAFDNDYGQNLEFYPDGYEVEVDGKKTYSGNNAQKTYTTDDDDSIILPKHYLVDSPEGEKQVLSLAVGDKINSNIGLIKIVNVEAINQKEIKLSFTNC